MAQQSPSGSVAALLTSHEANRSMTSAARRESRNETRRQSAALGTIDASCIEDMEPPEEDPAAVDSAYDDNGDDDTMMADRTDPETSNVNSAHTSTKSLVGSFLDYPIENDRRYHSIGPESYFMPNDDLEQTRLNILHQMYLLLFAPANASPSETSIHHCASLTLAPLPAHPTHVLDLGTGTGEWAINFAELFPLCIVTGTDISAIQPSAVPSNVFFEIDDAEAPGDWTFSHRHDLIHIRNMSGAFRDWKAVYREAYRHLKPGGWLEVADADHVTTGLGTADENPEVDQIVRAVGEAMTQAGRPWGVSHLKREIFEELGFVDLREHTFLLPVGPWREDERGKSIGKMWLIALLEGLEGGSLRPLTRNSRWTKEEVWEMCAKVRGALAGGTMYGKTGEGNETAYKVVLARRPFGDDTC